MTTLFQVRVRMRLEGKMGVGVAHWTGEAGVTMKTV